MTAPGPGTVRVAVEGPVARLTLEHRGRVNAVTGHMWSELERLVRDAGRDPDLRVVVLRGHGGVFSSGADLRELLGATADPDAARAFSLRVVRALHVLATSPLPTVAVLEHHVAGGGAEIALACDLRVARDDVSFRIPMSRLGVVPDRLTLDRLTALAGPAAARTVLLAGRALDAAGCLRVGLVDEVHPTSGLDAAVDALVADLLAGSAYSLARTKAMLLATESPGSPEDRVAEMVASLLDGGVAERARAFLHRARRD